MSVPRGRHHIVLLVGLAVASAGCSWLIGVSEDPVAAEGADAAAADGAMGETGRDVTTVDSADAGLDAEEDAPEDAPDDAEEE